MYQYNQIIEYNSQATYYYCYIKIYNMLIFVSIILASQNRTTIRYFFFQHDSASVLLALSSIQHTDRIVKFHISLKYHVLLPRNAKMIKPVHSSWNYMKWDVSFTFHIKIMTIFTFHMHTKQMTTGFISQMVIFMICFT